MKRFISAVSCLVFVMLVYQQSEASVFYGFEEATLPPEFNVYGDPGLNTGPTTLRSHDGAWSLGIGINSYSNVSATAVLTLPTALSSGGISWYQYDEYGRYSPYYMHASLHDSAGSGILGLSYYDTGWNYVYSGDASTFLHISNGIDNFNGPLRVAGAWSKYSIIFSNDTTNLYVNDAFVGSYSMGGLDVAQVRFAMHDYYGGPSQFQVDSLNISEASSVPEPSTMLLSVLSIAVIAMLRRRIANR